MGGRLISFSFFYFEIKGRFFLSDFEINTDEIIDQAVHEVCSSFSQDRLIIKEEYYNQIQLELKDISNYMVQKQHVTKIRKSAGLINPYAPEFGFSESEVAMEITKEKKDQAIVYNKINKILSFLRQGQEISYSLYIKDSSGKYYRYVVPENEIDNFTSIVQQNAFGFDENLRKFGEAAIERLEAAELMNQHIQKYMEAIDATGLKIKLADKYEAFEYHYQKIDNQLTENFSHPFNIEGIKRWLLSRGHDTIGWWVRGDIGLTSVKSINLNNKFLLLNLASQKSLTQVYLLLKELFSSQILSEKVISRLVKAFTPIVSDLKKQENINIKQIIEELINSLIK